MIKYVIPAREGSKGLPQKNQKLFQFTAMTIPYWKSDSVYVTSDDKYILKLAYDRRYNLHQRSQSLCKDDTNMKDVLLDISSGWPGSDLLVMLYLTYPERTWDDIKNALEFFIANSAKSMLCRKEWKYTHPALCMFERLDSNKGKQIFEHDYYRRQDYPDVFEISHYIFICQINELPKLNKNLYNDETIFFPIDPGTIDVDTESDLRDFVNKIKYQKEV